MKNKKYIMIGKCLFFPKEKILCIGDLHLGYEQMLHESGVMIPFKQSEQTISDLNKVFDYLKKEKLKIKKIILLGDIKHYFPYNKAEKFGLFELLDFFRKYVDDKDIILIRGNHDKVNIGKKFKDFYIKDDIAFIHGHKNFTEINDKKIKYVIMSHIHPSVVLRDEYKKEKYKCFLVGKYKSKQFVILPSFLPLVTGVDIENIKRFISIIPQKSLKEFEVFVVGKELEALEFGKLKNIE